MTPHRAMKLNDAAYEQTGWERAIRSLTPADLAELTAAWIALHGLKGVLKAMEK